MKSPGNRARQAGPQTTPRRRRGNGGYAGLKERVGRQSENKNPPTRRPSLGASNGGSARKNWSGAMRASGKAFQFCAPARRGRLLHVPLPRSLERGTPGGPTCRA
ncbi:hypothetical protein VP06_08560 [Methylobacterium aquaticum]|uniref:Uncharacterized protein n=1 Tax=Methylobacterium aquaticum TaxID=270351 RepID=A0A0J6SU12_9HYPH|nr:hypothetical protein VP06_08560 [Methylobacterium aquaticum]